jgi:hypothetical protein
MAFGLAPGDLGGKATGVVVAPTVEGHDGRRGGVWSGGRWVAVFGLRARVERRVVASQVGTELPQVHLSSDLDVAGREAATPPGEVRQLGQPLVVDRTSPPESCYPHGAEIPDPQPTTRVTSYAATSVILCEPGPTGVSLLHTDSGVSTAYGAIDVDHRRGICSLGSGLAGRLERTARRPIRREPVRRFSPLWRRRRRRTSGHFGSDPRSARVAAGSLRPRHHRGTGGLHPLRR